MVARGLFRSQIALATYPKTGVVSKLSFVPLPHNEDYELDLHRPYIDEIELVNEKGESLTRVPDVLDTWFDSGSMPYAQVHYPFENKERFEKTYPAQFIAEGIDQTRAWFYYLHVLAGALFRRSAFQNVIVNGTVLAEDGKKMSKRLQNYPDPMAIVEKYGADALRLYLLSSPVTQSENLSFSESGVDEVAKKNIGRLMNVLAFYKLYEDGTERADTSANILDRWMLARFAELLKETIDGYEKYGIGQSDAATCAFHRRPFGVVRPSVPETVLKKKVPTKGCTRDVAVCAPYALNRYCARDAVHRGGDIPGPARNVRCGERAFGRLARNKKALEFVWWY